MWAKLRCSTPLRSELHPFRGNVVVGGGRTLRSLLQRNDALCESIETVCNFIWRAGFDK